MIFKFTGQCSAMIGPDYTETLANMRLRLYRYRGTKYVTSLAISDLADTIKVLSSYELEATQASFIAEATTDDEGNFSFEFGPENEYNGEAVEIHLVVDSIPGRRSSQPFMAREIYLTTMKPRWESFTIEEASGPEKHAAWSCTLPAQFWYEFRQAHDAWVIVGRVCNQNSKSPVGDVRVTAFDTDRYQDDLIGTAVTDQFGHFRINYGTEQFTKTPLSPLYNSEEGGPDLYFRVETADGLPLLVEPREVGHTQGRQDIGACFSIELPVASELVKA